MTPSQRGTNHMNVIVNSWDVWFPCKHKAVFV